MKLKKLTGFALATAAAGLFAVTAAGPVGAQEAKVKCEGVNACKGQSECHSYTNSCKGTNACKGQGWLKMASPEKCRAAGGTVVGKA